MKTDDRQPTEKRAQAEAQRLLDVAIAEHARLTDRYRAAAGTTAELSTYMAVRAAADRIAACSRWLTFAQWDGPAAEVVRLTAGTSRRSEP